MHVNVSFTLNIDPAAWDDRLGSGTPVYDDNAAQRIAAEVRAHAENVVRDLFTDMGWTVDTANDAGHATASHTPSK